MASSSGPSSRQYKSRSSKRDLNPLTSRCRPPARPDTPEAFRRVPSRSRPVPKIAAAIEDAFAGSGIAGPDDEFNGDSPRNIVNRLTVGGRGGIHLEQSRAARTGHALDIADAVTHVFAGRLARPPDPGPLWWRLLRRLWDALRSRLQS